MVIIKILLAVIFLAVVIYGISYLVDIYAPASQDASEVKFAVEKGESVKQISARLAEAGLIRSDFNFRVYVWLKKIEKNMQAGEYKLAKNLNAWRLAKILTSAQSRPEAEIKIIEGWTNKEIGEYLEKQGLMDKEDFIKAAENRVDLAEQYDFLMTADKYSLEGYLFPDTYRVYREADSEMIIERMLANFNQKLTPELRAEIGNQRKTINEIIIMASIIEREVRDDDERAIAADIFYKRLAIGMPLQADSTVNYATGKKNPRASFEDLQVDSPYNTYKYIGLPPGPIGNPGLSAIKAAVYPEKNDYWYFLTTPAGEAVFSKTNEEHNINKTKYWP